MKKLNLFGCVLLILVLLITMVGCSRDGQQTIDPGNSEENTKGSTQSSDGEKKILGFSVWTMEWEFFQLMESGVKSKAQELGYEYILHDQRGDEAQMVSGCQDLINQGVDVLLISPIRPEALGPIIENAHDKDIPVIIVDIGGGGYDYDAIIISDNYLGGKLMAEYAVEAAKGNEGSREVAIADSDPSHEYSMRRGDGFRDVLEAAGYKVVKRLSNYADPPTAYNVMNDILTAHPDIRIVYNSNDPTAVAAIQAAKDANKAVGGDDGILFCGFDAVEQGLVAVNSGDMLATIKQFPDEMGKIAVELATQKLNGEELKFDNPELREIYAPVELITKENVAEHMPK